MGNNSNSKKTTMVKKIPLSFSLSQAPKIGTRNGPEGEDDIITVTSGEAVENQTSTDLEKIQSTPSIEKAKQSGLKKHKAKKKKASPGK